MDWSTLFSTPIGELLAHRSELQRRHEAERPAIGATLCCAGLRMTVQAGLSDELWLWLARLGWRELQPRENRLHFKPLPTSLVTRLFDGPAADRDRVLLAAIRYSTHRGTTRIVLPERRPSSVT
jgi:hypothetical protein